MASIRSIQHIQKIKTRFSKYETQFNVMLTVVFLSCWICLSVRCDLLALIYVIVIQFECHGKRNNINFYCIAVPQLSKIFIFLFCCFCFVSFASFGYDVILPLRRTFSSFPLLSHFLLQLFTSQFSNKTNNKSQRKLTRRQTKKKNKSSKNQYQGEIKRNIII